MADATADAFRGVGDMEIPLDTVRNLVTGLALIAETLNDSDGRAIQSIAWLAIEKCDAIEEMRKNLFRLTHPQRDHFEKEGWPS